MATRVPRHRIEVGDFVFVQMGGYEARARVIEDRGNLGIGGRRLIRVRTDPPAEDAEPREFEVPEEEVRPAPV